MNTKINIKKSELSSELAELRKIERDARRRRFELLKRDLTNANVKLHYSKGAENRADRICILWLNGPNQPSGSGRYTMISNVVIFNQFVRNHYDGLDIDDYDDDNDELYGDTVETLFKELLAKANGYHDIARSALETILDDDDNDDDDDE